MMVDKVVSLKLKIEYQEEVCEASVVGSVHLAIVREF
jgi:hypothetical protein